MLNNVLVIDNNPASCKVLQDYARQAGVENILVAQNGRNALSALQHKSSQVDFIVLGLNLPDFDSIELLSKIKELSFSGPIAIASSVTPVVIKLAASLGQQLGLNVVDAISKPLTKKTVDRWFASETGVAASGHERRGAPRVNLDLDGFVKAPDSPTSIPCTVRDISQTGARLQIKGADYMPDAFRLHLEHEGISSECVVRWRSGTEVGVSFKSARDG